MATATPRNLDPKYKDAEVPDDNPQPYGEPAESNVPNDKTEKVTEETDEEVRIRLRSTEIPKDPNEGMITYRQSFVDSAGNVGEKIHGPMPRSEWAAYSAANGL